MLVSTRSATLSGRGFRITFEAWLGRYNIIITIIRIIIRIIRITISIRIIITIIKIVITFTTTFSSTPLPDDELPRSHFIFSKNRFICHPSPYLHPHHLLCSQGGRTWQPFVGGKNGHENFRQARIYIFCNKCVVFARNRKFAKLTQ